MSSGEETVQDSVPSNDVLDASDDPVNEVMQRWLLFIALHLESDSEFSDDDLVDDVLLALGFQDEDERKRLSAPETPHLVHLGDRLQELDDTWLVDRITDETGIVRFQVAADLDRIDQAVVALGGSIWTYGDTNRLDTEMELAWLLIIALRMHSGRIAHNDLLNRLSSLLGRDGSYHEQISEISHDLERRGLIQISEGFSLPRFRRRLFNGYRIVDDEHVGLDKLWERLRSEFGNQPLFFETVAPVADESVTASDDQLVDDDVRASIALASLELAEAPVEAESVEPSEIAEQQETPQQQSTLAASATGTRDPDAPVDRPRSVRPQPFEDVDLCMAILEVLVDGFYERDASIQEIRDGLLKETKEVSVLTKYDAEPPPPWTWTWPDNEGPTFESPIFKSLLDFRLDHCLRAMSLHSTGMIRSTEKPSHWQLTQAGINIVMSHGKNSDKADLGEEISNYFHVHDYSSWEDTEWITEFMERLVDLGRDGVFFEQLCLELLRKVHPGAEVSHTVPNGWLDRNAVDHVIETTEEQVDEEGDLDKEQAGMSESHSHSRRLLVQCKRWAIEKEIDAGQIAKLFASAARFRAQAQGTDKRKDIEGARFIYLGNLSHDATWIYWSLRDAWERLDASAPASGEDTSQLRWELWDGAKLFSLIKEHELGVNVDWSSNNVTIDKPFFDQLKEGANERKKRPVDPKG